MKPLFSIRLSLLAALLVVTSTSRASAGDGLSARDIVDKTLTRNFFGFENAKVTLTMQLHGKSGNVRKRSLQIKSRKTGEQRNQTMARFLAPPDVAGTTFLVIERQGDDDEQYLFLPAFGKVKRISGRQKNQRFLGTDFTYGDLQSNALKTGRLTRLADATVGGAKTYVVEAVPSDGDSQYAKVVTWIQHDTFIPIKMAFYDKGGQLYKEMKVFQVKKHDGRFVVTQSEMKDLKRGTKTSLTVDQIDSKAQFSDDDFNQAAMQR